MLAQPEHEQKTLGEAGFTSQVLFPVLLSEQFLMALLLTHGTLVFGDDLAIMSSICKEAWSFRIGVCPSPSLLFPFFPVEKAVVTLIHPLNGITTVPDSHL